MAEVTWNYYWTNDGPYAPKLADLRSGDQNGKVKAEIKKLEEERDSTISTSLDFLYGYTKHVAVVIARFCKDVGLQSDDRDGTIKSAFDKLSFGPKSWMDLEPATMESRIRNLKTADVRAIALVMLKRMEETKTLGTTYLDVFDQCVLPIKPRLHGAIPRAFLGGDVAESGEGLGFMKNKLSRYVRHPAIIPKATLLSWAKFEANQAELSKYRGWFYSLKYDGWSAIWTGTKLVTANGRQTFTTMPEPLQNALLTVRCPLVGELVLLQTSDKYDNKERMQALVRGERTADVVEQNKIAQRIVFMVYDTPSSKYAYMDYKARLNELKEKILRHPEGVGAKKFTVKDDRVGLIQQTQLNTKMEATLGEALFAATAAEQEGLMLTPNVPYAQLHTAEYRRRKLKPLYQFTVKPDPPDKEDPAKEETDGADMISSITVSIPDLPKPFEDRKTQTTKIKFRIENGIWFESTTSPTRLRFAKHKWGFHPVIMNTAAESADILVLPKAMLNARDAIFSAAFPRGHGLPAGDNIQLWTLVASHFLHPKTVRSGRPHYPTHAPNGTEEIKVAHTVFSGEASSEEVRSLVREASMLAERSAEQPYNEWLCRMHRAYEGASLWKEFSRDHTVVEPPKVGLDVQQWRRLMLVPGEPFTFYTRDMDRSGTEPDDSPYTVYKLVKFDKVPVSGYMYDPGTYFTPEDESTTPLPRRICGYEMIIDQHDIQSRVWPENQAIADLSNMHGFYGSEEMLDFKTDRNLKNYMLAEAESKAITVAELYNANVTAGVASMSSPSIQDEPNASNNGYTLVWYENSDYYLATHDPQEGGWQFGDGEREKENHKNNLVFDGKITKDAALKAYKKLHSGENPKVDGSLFPIGIELVLKDTEPVRSKPRNLFVFKLTTKRDNVVYADQLQLRVFGRPRQLGVFYGKCQEEGVEWKRGGTTNNQGLVSL